MLDYSYNKWYSRKKWQKNEKMKAMEESNGISLNLRTVRMVWRTEDIRHCVGYDRAYGYHEKAKINDYNQRLTKPISRSVVEVEPQPRYFI